MDYGVVARGSLVLRRPGDLAERVVGAPRESEAQRIVAQSVPPAARLVTFQTQGETAAALLANQAEAVVIARQGARDLLTRNPNSGMAYKFTLGSRWLGAAIRFGEHDLLRAVNLLLFTMREDGRLAAIPEKYGHRLPGPLPVL